MPPATRLACKEEALEDVPQTPALNEEERLG
jgi:hypothetical protein